VAQAEVCKTLHAGSIPAAASSIHPGERSVIFPFWETVIAPLVRAVAPSTIVEIGALRGDTTMSLLESLGSDVRLHVIDPVPQFDPAEHAQRFRGEYIFHGDTSMNVLPTLEPVDVALIDGDHNWYTVYNELRLLESQAREAGRPPPVFILHDISWPYGRRDGYYAPETIPLRFRQPNAQLGLERGNPGLRAEGGSNRHIWNAQQEGGKRNGVRTALEDFLAHEPGAFRSVMLDLYVGLGLAAPTERLERQPELAHLFEDLGSDEGLQRVRGEVDEVVRAAVASGALKLGRASTEPEHRRG
jgi:hypothetical protein